MAAKELEPHEAAFLQSSVQISAGDPAFMAAAISMVETGKAPPSDDLPRWFVGLLLVMGGLGFFMFLVAVLGIGDVAAFAAHHLTTEIASWRISKPLPPAGL